TITASQPGDRNYEPAGDVAGTFAVAKATQAIEFAAIDDHRFGDAPFAVGPTASSGLDVTLAASGKCSVTDSQVTIPGGGACRITASQSGDDDYAPADDVTRSFAIAKAPATLTLGSLSATFDGTPKTASVATTPDGLSGVAVTYDGSADAPAHAGTYAV